MLRALPRGAPPREQLFIVINGYYILRWLLAQEALVSALEWSEEGEALFTNCFAPLGFRRAQFSRLLRSATFVRANETEADVLTIQGEPLLDLFVPLNGTVEVCACGCVHAAAGGRRARARGRPPPLPRGHGRCFPPSLLGAATCRLLCPPPCWPAAHLPALPARPCQVRIGGAVASTLPPYVLVGEASLLDNLQSPNGELHPPARATVVAAPGSSYVRWPQRVFYELQEEEDSDFGYAIQLMIARTLSEKLSKARLSQRESEERLRDRRIAAMSGASPMELAARRRGEGESALPTGRSAGAGAEVEALLRQNAAKDSELRMLEQSLAQSKAELADLQSVVALVGASLLLLCGGGLLTTYLPSHWWWQTFGDAAANEFLNFNLN